MGGIIPAATTTLASTKPTADAIFGAFIPFGYMEVGVMVGAVIIVLIIGIISGIPERLRAMLAHSGVRKFDSPASHRDSAATSAAIREHNRFKKIMSGRGISRYD